MSSIDSRVGLSYVYREKMAKEKAKYFERFFCTLQEEM